MKKLFLMFMIVGLHACAGTQPTPEQNSEIPQKASTQTTIIIQNSVVHADGIKFAPDQQIASIPTQTTETTNNNEAVKSYWAWIALIGVGAAFGAYGIYRIFPKQKE